MINQLPQNIIRFFVLILFQVLVLNNVHLTNINAHLFFYVLFILLLPFETPKWLLLLIGFVTGITIDIFSDTYGLHACASVFMAFMRPFMLDLNSPREGYETGTTPNIQHYGIEWFARYSIVLIFVHHFVYYYVEAFTLDEFWHTMFRVFLSAILTFVAAIVSQLFYYRK